ncbi:uncharacterized protein BCR38DRAFT_43759 [Pseudomassariella vexata]|uniref:RING-type domain-containing protein n=1 Tax=Pseudomassariella vexata TaxID=1141098 RepID=A0A1Y2DNB3_9PEZI|nr:uncharacterized protein BCR38DRAFT_43759 [Pseudomassariella vexata]ORY60644.1 hypothetical protein BCR38DRAFT_43759 [Pseudomassariella vexata]
MRPPRIAILVLFFAACLFLLCRSITSVGQAGPTATVPAASQQQSGFRSFFSFSAPFTLFPPNAIITIANDNSTSFAARPAAFGPPLPTKGLDGQLWIGSGFTEESLQDGEGEGELGCSDVPGWDDGTNNAALKTASKEVKSKSKSPSGTAASKTKSLKRDDDSKSPMVDRTAASDSKSKTKEKSVDDGTDDYLQDGLETSQKSQTDANSLSGSGHADIQSIQEGAEIAGKIVLLSRGGCGFLEKVKWAQRRGAVGLIVGDNQRGGPLIQMFARGDTSNVTIPSIFTSRTTAYLLSLMMQPGSYIEDIIDENGKPSLQVQHSDKARKNKKTTATAVVPKATATPKAKASAAKNAPSTTGDPAGSEPRSQSWFAQIFSWHSSSDSADRSRPPNSGQHDWVLVEDFSDEKDKIIRNSLEKASKSETEKDSKSSSKQSNGDGFQIGVEDWRDPDLVGSQGPSKGSNKPSEKSGQSTTSKQDIKSSKDPNGPKDKSITKTKSDKTDSKSSGHGGLLAKLFGDDDGADFSQTELHPPPINTPIIEKPAPGENGPSPPEEREGLWVIITPSSGASPFFDTLLVLVISPLITLTVVYALLILRARIRRRRWRAPKSVVERLPVRTYHTVASTPSPSPRLQSPSPPSPTTPLLQSQHGPSRPRPRSRTTTGVPSAGDLLQVNSSLQIPRSPTRGEHEKTISSEWKKYMGRQVECVVCLEEYVDGVSQVMSLPCGHEFHVDCITPWLTTRRRTCPICKGDVVRSLARGSTSSPRYEPYRDDSDDDFLAQGSSSSANLSPRSASRQDDGSDVEQGILSPAPRRAHRQVPQEGWLGILSNGFRNATSSRPRSSGESEEDRAR